MAAFGISKVSSDDDDESSPRKEARMSRSSSLLHLVSGVNNQFCTPVQYREGLYCTVQVIHQYISPGRQRQWHHQLGTEVTHKGLDLGEAGVEAVAYLATGPCFVRLYRLFHLVTGAPMANGDPRVLTTGLQLRHPRPGEVRGPRPQYTHLEPDV